MNRKSGDGSSLPTWHVTQHVQTQSLPKPGPFPRFSSSMKGIIVSVWVLLQKMPSGSEKVLATLMGIPRAQITCQRSLTLGRNGLAVIPLLCSLIGWEQPECGVFCEPCSRAEGAAAAASWVFCRRTDPSTYVAATIIHSVVEPGSHACYLLLPYL